MRKDLSHDNFVKQNDRYSYIHVSQYVVAEANLFWEKVFL